MKISNKVLKASLLLLSFLLPVIISFRMQSRFGTTASSLDALSHLYIPKNVIHNGSDSGIRNFGTVWLPFYHLLLVPFVAIDSLYFTGFAGTILGMISFFAATLLLLRFLPFPYNTFAALFFICHPYALLYATSPMTETLAAFLLLFVAYHFYRFLETGKGGGHLILGVILGTLTRYEFYVVLILLFPFFLRKAYRTYPKMKILLFAFALFSGIISFLLWNFLLFSDPFFFYNHPITKGTLTPLPYAGSVKNVLTYNLFILRELFGYLPLFSAIGIFYLLLRRRLKYLLSLLLTISPLFTHLLLAYLNISLGYSRFFLLSFPGLILLAFSFLSHLENKLIRLPLLFLLPFFYFLPLIPAYSVFNRGENHYKERINLSHQDINYPQVSDYLRRFKSLFQEIDLRSSCILIPCNQEFQLISFALRTRPERLFDAYDSRLVAIMDAPEKFCDYILLPRSPSLFDSRFQSYYKGHYFVSRFFAGGAYRENLLSHFSSAREDNHWQLFKRSASGVIDFPRRGQ